MKPIKVDCDGYPIVGIREALTPIARGVVYWAMIMVLAVIATTIWLITTSVVPREVIILSTFGLAVSILISQLFHSSFLYFNDYW